MNKTITRAAILLILISIGLVACSASKTEDAKSEDAQKRATTGVSAESPVEVVAQLYRDFVWEAVIEEPASTGRGLLEQPRDVLMRYFDDALADLLLKDRLCVEQKHEICLLDFQPIWDSQDPSANEMRIAASKDPDVVAVTFKTAVPGEKVQLLYRMSKTGKGWRVHDIVYQDVKRSLLELLNSPSPR